MFVDTIIHPETLLHATSVSSKKVQLTDVNCQAERSSADLLETWDSAYDLWINSRRASNTRRSYRTAWKQFLEFTRKQPWDVTSTDIAGWIESQRVEGLAACTIRQRLAAISSFYTYTTRTYTLLGSNGREQPLHNFNPVNAVSRPKVSPYGKAKYLSVDQARAFLRAIPRSYPQGLRDYALFLGYLLTGRRNSEIRTLRWGDFDIDSTRSFSEKNCQAIIENRSSDRIFYRWHGKGKDRRDECPHSLWKAINDYLRAADRLETITPEHYIFTALNNNASRLPNVHSSIQEACSFEDQNCQAVGNQQPVVPQPLTARFVGKLLKRYAHRAGLDPRRVNVHTLRHTAAMLRKEAGEDLEAISRFLNHSTLSVTQVYLHRIEGCKDNAWLKVEAMLGLT